MRLSRALTHPIRHDLLHTSPGRVPSDFVHRQPAYLRPHREAGRPPDAPRRHRQGPGQTRRKGRQVSSAARNVRVWGLARTQTTETRLSDRARARVSFGQTFWAYLLHVGARRFSQAIDRACGSNAFYVTANEHQIKGVVFSIKRVAAVFFLKQSVENSKCFVVVVVVVVGAVGRGAVGVRPPMAAEEERTCMLRRVSERLVDRP